MNKFILAAIIFCLTIQTTYSQQYDSTTQFKTYPLESVVLKSWSFMDEEFDATLPLTDSSDRSSLLILDKELRHCDITARLIEYRNGIKTRDAIVLFKEAIYNNPRIASFEDSAFVFSLYRKPIKDNQFMWGFRTPSMMKIEKVEMSKPEGYWPYLVGLPEQKLPIGKPFVFLVFTMPDSKGEFPFLRTEHKNKYSPYDWNKTFNLPHTFLIELTIEKSTDYKKNNPT